MVDGYLNFNTQISTKGFEKGLDSIGNGLDSLKSKLAGVASMMGLAFGAGELIETAAAVNAESSALTQTFGVLEDAAVHAMQRVADASGILRTRLQATGTQIYAFARTSGMDSVTALGMMEEALTVAADSAAYYDRSLEETAATLQSFLKGNYANDAALGLSATETTRNAAAMQLYGKSFRQLSEAQKQLVLLQMVKDANRLSGAMGQAARESEGWENVLGNLKEAWRQLLAVVGQPVLRGAIVSVKAVTAAVSALTQQAQTAVNTLNRLFGWEADRAASASSAIAQSVDNQNALTDAVEETSKAQQRELAGFDKIQKLGTAEHALESPEIVPTLDTAPLINAERQAGQQTERIFGRMLDLFAPLQAAWDSYGSDLTASLQRTHDNAAQLAAAFGDSFTKVWTNGTGEEITGTVLRTFTALSDTIGNLTGRAAIAWNTDGLGTEILQNAADQMLSLLHTVEECSQASAEWSAGLDFTPLLRSFSGLQQSVSPILDKLGGAVSWVWKNLFLPLGKWTIEAALPASLDVLSGALDTIDAVLEVLRPRGEWLWTEFISPLASWTGGIVVDGLEDLADALHDLGDWIREHPDAGDALWDIAGALGGIAIAVRGAALIGNFADALAKLSPLILGESSVISSAFATVGAAGGVSFGAALLPAIVAFIAGWGIGSAIYDIMGDEIDAVLWPVFDQIVGFFDQVKYWTRISLDYIKEWISRIPEHIQQKAQEAYNNTLRPFEKIGEWAADRMGEIKSAFSVTRQWFGETFGGAVDNIKEKFSAVKGFAEQAWTDITSPFAHVADWFHETFSHAWERVLEVFSRGGSVFQGIEAGIASVFRDTVNGLIDGINNVLAVPFWNISEALRVIREWSIWLPWAGDWRPFEWLPTIDIPRIPRLAQGTVVPANYGEFLAILGDNKREAEVVSPLSAIEEAVGRMLDKKLSGMVIEIHNAVDLDGRKIYRSIVRRNADAVAMTGKNPLIPEGGST